jgi:hypothetical protein
VLIIGARVDSSNATVLLRLTCVPDLHQGSSSFFLMGSLSPVRLASSTTRP